MVTMPLQISSLQNQRIKQVVKLNNRRQRDREKLTLVEGVREADRALAAGLVPVAAYLCPPLLEGAEAWAVVERLQALAAADRTEVFEVTTAVFQKMAYRGESGGLLLVVPYLVRDLADFSFTRPPFLVLLEGVEKPGNLGAILRTADAAGVDGVVVCGQSGAPGTDIHNPNVVRASLGALFTVPVLTAENGRLLPWLRQHHIQIVATTPQAQQPYWAVDMRCPTAIVMGSEAHGLTDFWLTAADCQAVVPMHGAVDSLNLSVATALLLYEVVRQRNGP